MIPVGLFGGGPFTFTVVTATTLADSALWLGAASSGSSIIVAGYNGLNGRINRSTNNGQTWSTITPPTNIINGSVAFGNGAYVVAGPAANPSGVSGNVQVSTDNGLTFSAVLATTGTGNAAQSVIFDGTRFLLIEQAGASDKIAFSTNGTTWSQTAALTPQVGGNGRLAFTGTTYIIQGAAVGSTTSGICTSNPTVGTNWTTTTAPATALEFTIAGNGVFMCGGANTATYYTSANGSTWTTRTLPATTTGTPGFANGFFWFKAVTTNVIWFSADGVNWTSTGLGNASPGRTRTWFGNEITLLQIGTTTADGVTNAGSYTT